VPVLRQIGGGSLAGRVSGGGASGGVVLGVVLGVGLLVPLLLFTLALPARGADGARDGPVDGLAALDGTSQLAQERAQLAVRLFLVQLGLELAQLSQQRLSLIRAAPCVPVLVHPVLHHGCHLAAEGHTCGCQKVARSTQHTHALDSRTAHMTVHELCEKLCGGKQRHVWRGLC
jgi:hypothetical protein